MDKAEFISRIYNMPCERCPIYDYCQVCKAFSCGSTARQYYNSHSTAKEGFKWPIKTDLSITALSSD